VVGVHGNPQVVAWSAATVGGVPINKAIPPNILDRDKLADECKHWSQSIIRAKGSTPFGLGSIVSSLCASIFLDKRNVCPVSHFQPDFGCYFSLPAVLGKKGVMSTIHMPLDSDEEAHVAKSAKELSETIDWIHRSY
jgi:L-lactate dehydrogenase